jgi:hypothetical protein
VTVELLPGVNVSIPIVESSIQPVPRPEMNRPASRPEFSSRDPLGPLAEALWPHFRARLDDYLATSQRARDSNQDDENSQRNRGKRKTGGQTQLPLSNPKRY